MKPTPYVDHAALLTLNFHELPVFKDALPGVDAQPLFLDPHNGAWVLRAMFRPGTRLPTHYHTGDVHFFTLKGRWNYVEYPDQPQTAGSYLYEPGGSIHTFAVPEDAAEDAEGLMIVRGANMNFDDNGQYVGILDASWLMQMFDHLVKERGMEPARYITPPPVGYTA
ncbi:2,4'-dihydroxyacetophenone dioxygenase family protein [Solimonas marina]|uniref:2,4'-dihydroxyacetophenone dioxygenase n=1 Tax=Solimonas marina TaxID=2714601 RepID=A0A969WBE3_9GAMM|nr:2,4'-dihydroxyacetophenone dioxygenase family protein [Solimonas marina]NKF23005.1 2,4'-dihydroxyacetophenone dioxygenase [Solimonas marina]